MRVSVYAREQHTADAGTTGRLNAELESAERPERANNYRTGQRIVAYGLYDSVYQSGTVLRSKSTQEHAISVDFYGLKMQNKAKGFIRVVSSLVFIENWQLETNNS